MDRLMGIAPLMAASLIGLSCEKQEQGANYSTSQVDRTLEGLVERHQEYLENGAIGGRLAWSSQEDYSSLLNVQHIYIKEGTIDCPPCKAQAPEFERIGKKYEEITSEKPDLIGFAELDIGKLADRSFLDNTITAGTFVPKYSHWIAKGRGFELAEMFDNLPELEKSALGVVDSGKRERSGKGGFAGNNFIAGHVPEYDAVLILDRIARNPESVSYREGQFVISYDWSNTEERFLVLRSNSLRQRGVSFYGAEELAEIDREFFRAREEKVLNPDRQDGKGIVVDADKNGLRRALEIIADIPHVLDEETRRWYADSFPTFSPEKIIVRGSLIEEITALSDDGMEVSEGSTDVSDFVNIAGGWIPLDYRDALALSTDDVVYCIDRARRVQEENLVVVPEPYKALHQGYLDYAGNFSGYMLPSREEASRALENIVGERDLFFDSERKRLLEIRDYIAGNLDRLNELGVSVHYAGDGEARLRGEINSGISVYFGADLDSPESITERAARIENLRERFPNSGINYGLIDIPPKFSGFFPKDIGAGNILMPYIPVSGEPSKVYAVFKNGRVADFGHLDVLRSEEKIYNILESCYNDGNGDRYNDN